METARGKKPRLDHSMISIETLLILLFGRYPLLIVEARRVRKNMGGFHFSDCGYGKDK